MKENEKLKQREKTKKEKDNEILKERQKKGK